MIPKALKKGDTIGVVSTSDPITKDEIEQIEKAVKKVKELGLNVKFGKYAYENPTRIWRNCKT